VGIVAWIVAVLLALGALWVFSEPAGAHTDLLQGSPGPGQQAGGEIDFIDLVFVEPVTDAVVTLQDPDGNLIDGETTNPDGQIIRFESSDPIEITGRYIVRYNMTSADGDFTEAAYFFTYNPESVQPVRLGQLATSSTLRTVGRIAAGVVFAACIIGLALLFLTKLERDRAAASNTQ
jgi:methionine-rich copper-binding protein CopC